MNYEVKNMEEKNIVGVSARTGNADPKMGEIIGGLWKKFYEEGICATIKGCKSPNAIGLYSDYDKDSYDVTVGYDASVEGNEAYVIKTIPAGKYAVFSIEGDMVKAVADAWGEIWSMELNRSFTGDYEEYLDNDMEHGKINIYIALK